MNHPNQQLISAQQEEQDGFNLAAFLDFLFDYRGLIASVALVVIVSGIMYAFIAKPIYEANIMIQVEDSPNSSKNILGDLVGGGIFDIKTIATSEMELLRSRLIVSSAVDRLRLTMNTRPKYFPVFGAWLAKHNKQLSDPIFGGYVWGAEKLDISHFDLPASLQNVDFTFIVEAADQFRVSQSEKGIEFTGKVGKTLNVNTEYGPLELRVDSLLAKPGAHFSVNIASRLKTIERLQKALVIIEKGKQSGVIGVSLEGADPILTSRILNTIGREYVRQNVERKSEEAEKSVIFLDQQLPELKRKLEQAEDKYNQFRSKNGTIDLGEEAKAFLLESVTVQGKLIELKQKKEELLVRFTKDNPVVIGIDHQLRAITGEIKEINGKIKTLPNLEQETLRLSRDVRVNTDLYTTLLNSVQQLRLLKASKVGSARLIDAAMIPEEPIRPQRLFVTLISILLGLFTGVICALIKKRLYGKLNDAHEIERALGVSVYATIPHSKKQVELYQFIHAKSKKVSVLAQVDSSDSAIESLRSLRTALQFSMIGANNNVVLITGATPGLGKSFVSVNFAAVLAAAGKRVLLLDADLRKGYLHQYFGLERQLGLSDVVLEVATIDQIIHRDVIPNLDFIATGVLPPNPAELLSHENFLGLFKIFSANYDYILIDTPPVLTVSDSLVMCTVAAGIFLVARAGVSTTSEINESIKRFNQTGVTPKGIIFNDMQVRPGRYGYGYQYRHAEYKY